MELEARRGRIALAAVIGFVGLILLFRLSAFGIWDPWELNSADAARHLLAGEDPGIARPSLPSWLVASGFGAFGVREWAGRLPLALVGLLTVGLAYLLMARYAGRRAGVYAALITGTTPLFLFNSRQMLGDSPAFFAQTLLALGAMAAVYGFRSPRPRAVVGDGPDTSQEEDPAIMTQWRVTALWLCVAAVGLVLSVWARGALVGALPPLLAIVVVAGLRGELVKPKSAPQRVALYVLATAATAVTFAVARAVIADHEDFGLALGGKPVGGNPPTYEVNIETVFHAFAPWSALLPLALGRLLLRGQDKAHDSDARDVQGTEPLPAFLLLWAIFAYGTLTLFSARYGSATFVAVVALAGAVALLLRDVEESRTSWWTAGAVGAMFVGLILRDYGLYPAGPIDGLAVADAAVPEVFNPKLIWTGLLLGFMSVLVLGFAADAEAQRPDMRAPYRLLKKQWRLSLPHRIWLACIGIALGVAILFGATLLIAGNSLGFTSLIQKAGLPLVLLLLLPVLVLLGQWLLYGFTALGQYRLVPLLIAGCAFGAYATQGYLPALSAHFSPREVYDTFNTLAGEGESLAEYRVGGRAAAYYAESEVVEISNQAELINHLKSEQRRWAAFPTDELPAIDRAYRRAAGEHLFVADARSARVVLATNKALEGVDNQSFVAKYVLDAPPAIEHPVGAKFEDKIELIGYDLDLPHEGYVGPGESFKVTWYWRALTGAPGSWKVFLHVDGHGLRLNGDHDPVEEKYPVRLWDEGDVVVDVQELTVPANYRPGQYTMFIGFYAGDNRLKISEGPKDDADRLRAGALTVR